jgi:hypothetical protein
MGLKRRKRLNRQKGRRAEGRGELNDEYGTWSKEFGCICLEDVFHLIQ